MDRPFFFVSQFQNSSQMKSNMPLPIARPTSTAASNKMRANRRVDTKPETRLRSSLHRSGLRFRKDYPIRISKRISNGRTVHPDIVFTRKKIAVFVDGCFWHSCPQHGTIPKSNEKYWIPKLLQNVERDRATDEGLRAGGWQVIRIWEHVGIDEATSTILSRVGKA